MPVGYRIDPARKLIVSWASGELTEVELDDHLAELTNDPAFNGSYDQIADLREITSLRISSTFVKRKSLHTAHTDRSRRAFVASSDVVFGTSRMFQILADEHPDEVRVFRDLDDALVWLGQDSLD